MHRNHRSQRENDAALQAEIIPTEKIDNESDEETKKREWRVAQRKLTYNDPRESIYSEATSMGYTAYSKIFDPPHGPRPQ